MPSGGAYRTLAGIIQDLARRHNTPVFEPHVTLAAGPCEAEGLGEKVSELASRLQPFPVKLERVDYLDDYFRCLFLRVESSKHLENATRQARKTLDLPPRRPYQPHLSLMYGHFGPGKKKTIVPLARDCEELTFEVQSFHLYLIEGEPEEWIEIRELPLLPKST